MGQINCSYCSPLTTCRAAGEKLQLRLSCAQGMPQESLSKMTILFLQKLSYPENLYWKNIKQVSRGGGTELPRMDVRSSGTPTPTPRFWPSDRGEHPAPGPEHHHCHSAFSGNFVYQGAWRLRKNVEGWQRAGV